MIHTTKGIYNNSKDDVQLDDTNDAKEDNHVEGPEHGYFVRRNGLCPLIHDDATTDKLEQSTCARDAKVNIRQ